MNHTNSPLKSYFAEGSAGSPPILCRHANLLWPLCRLRVPCGQKKHGFNSESVLWLSWYPHDQAALTHPQYCLRPESEGLHNYAGDREVPVFQVRLWQAICEKPLSANSRDLSLWNEVPVRLPQGHQCHHGWCFPGFCRRRKRSGIWTADTLHGFCLSVSIHPFNFSINFWKFSDSA